MFDPRMVANTAAGRLPLSFFAMPKRASFFDQPFAARPRFTGSIAKLNRWSRAPHEHKREISRNQRPSTAA